MMKLPPLTTLDVPLRMDESGTIRVSGTRVILDLLIARYHQGDSPEAIHEGYPGVPVEDIYAVIAYYLAHREALDAYLHVREEEAERLRQEIEASLTPAQRARREELRQLLAERRASATA